MGNSQKESCLINLKGIIGQIEDGTEEGSKTYDTDRIKNEVRECLKNCEVLKISLSGLRSFSPSVAYQSFGQLFDSPEKLKKLKDRIEFVDDERDLQSNIWKAIERRQKILLSG